MSTGLLADEAAQLNEAYIHFMRTGRPFVHLKLAVSLDGKIATRTRDSRWIAGEEARAHAHELRHRYDAIMVGSGTVLADDPLLTDRSGRPRRRPLVRVILDDRLRLPSDYQLSQSARETPVVLFTSSDIETAARAVGDPRRVLAGTDCGFDTSTGFGKIAEEVVWEKLRALRAGAELATKRLL